MGGFFGAVSKRDCVMDIFFGVDYHSHLGTKSGGMIVYDAQDGFQRQIHSIGNTPFRTKFEKDLVDFHGCSGVGCISDSDPQPLLGDYTAKPIVEGSSEKPTAALASVAFVLKGTPSMRFYLADGRDASEYKFYIDTKEVKTKVSDDGTYVDIDVYAYALCETVTYTVGEESGSFHINAYYSYVSGAEYTEADKTELISLTECFWNYLQSARAYRSSVTEG